MNRDRRLEALEGYAANTFVRILSDADRAARIEALRARVEAGRGEPGDALRLSDAERLARIEQILSGSGPFESRRPPGGRLRTRLYHSK